MQDGSKHFFAGSQLNSKPPDGTRDNSVPGNAKVSKEVLECVLKPLPQQLKQYLRKGFVKISAT